MRSFMTGFFYLAKCFQDSATSLTCVSTSFFSLQNNEFHYGYTHILFIYSSVDGHLDCFHFLAVMNNAAVKTHIQVFV